jgi:hypothetical protein
MLRSAYKYNMSQIPSEKQQERKARLAKLAEVKDESSGSDSRSRSRDHKDKKEEEAEKRKEEKSLLIEKQAE